MLIWSARGFSIYFRYNKYSGCLNSCKRCRGPWSFKIVHSRFTAKERIVRVDLLIRPQKKRLTRLSSSTPPLPPPEIHSDIYSCAWQTMAPRYLLLTSEYAKLGVCNKEETLKKKGSSSSSQTRSVCNSSHLSSREWLDQEIFVLFSSLSLSRLRKPERSDTLWCISSKSLQQASLLLLVYSRLFPALTLSSRSADMKQIANHHTLDLKLASPFPPLRRFSPPTSKYWPERTWNCLLSTYKQFISLFFFTF